MLTIWGKQRDLAERIAAVEGLGRTSCPNCAAPYQRRWPRPYEICSVCGHRFSLNLTVQSLAEFLDQLHRGGYPWDWFATLTFAKEGANSVNGRYWVRRFLREAGLAGAAKPYAFRADEYGPLYGRFHMHLLIGNVSHLQLYCGRRLRKGVWGQKCCWVHRWPCGYARIYHFDPQLGATFYLSKYVVKQLADWELIGFEPENLVFPKAE